MLVLGRVKYQKKTRVLKSKGAKGFRRMTVSACQVVRCFSVRALSFFGNICQTHQLFLTENVMRESFLAACHAVMLNMCHVQLCNSSDSSLKTFQKCTSTVFNSLTLHVLFVFCFIKNNTHHSPQQKTPTSQAKAGRRFFQPTHPHTWTPTSTM